MRVSERAGLHFKPVVPVALSHTLSQIAPDRERARLPLLDHVAVLVEHQPGILKEIVAASTKVDATASRRSDGSAVNPHEQGMFEDLHMVHGLFEQRFE
jgi:hypothetical protein